MKLYQNSYMIARIISK